MFNFPAQHKPLSWDDYKGHPSEVKRVQRWIAGAPDLLPQSLFVGGSTGVGKTSLISLLIRSIRCQNRVPGEFEPCGHCSSCLQTELRDADRSNSNIHWIQPGGFLGGTLDSAVKEALLSAEKGPIKTGNPHQDILFLVFDEWHKFASNLRQQVLLKCEVSSPRQNVMFIFITMSEDELPEKDLYALIGRGSRLRLQPFSTEEIASILMSKFSDLNLEAASTIAKFSRNDLRLAFSNYNECKQLDEYVTPESVAHTLKILTPQERLALWGMLESNCFFTTLRGYLESLTSKADPKRIAEQLHEDILTSMDSNLVSKSACISASRLLMQYIYSPYALPLLATLMQLRDMKIIDSEIIRKQSDYSLYAHFTSTEAE
jgi:DNA polymerase III delta prime subunit